ncbi:hypothetical protein ACFLXB_06000, partial [Chloroflexota bacterium]
MANKPEQLSNNYSILLKRLKEPNYFFAYIVIPISILNFYSGTFAYFTYNFLFIGVNFYFT